MRALIAPLLVLTGLAAITAGAYLAFGLPTALIIAGIQVITVGLLLPDGTDTDTERGADGQPAA